MLRKPRTTPRVVAASGFTIIELMFAIVVAAILLAIAVPSFNDAMSKTDVAQKTNDLVGAFTLARSEAASRGRTVCVDASDKDWNKGWDVKVDMNGDNKCDAAGDTVLRSYASPGKGFVVTPTAAVIEIAFGSAGALISGADQSITVCRKGGNVPHATLITVRSAGLVSSHRDKDASGTTCS